MDPRAHVLLARLEARGQLAVVGLVDDPRQHRRALVGRQVADQPQRQLAVGLRAEAAVDLGQLVLAESRASLIPSRCSAASAVRARP